MSDLICRECGCENPAIKRGLCEGHYSKYRWRVQNGHTTWGELVSRGIASKAKNKKLNLALGCYQLAEKSDIALRFGGDKAKIEKHLNSLREKYAEAGVVS